MYVILALLMLGVLIITHELGHFLAARACGIPVQEFSVGMGPLLLSRTGKSGTKFSLRAFPVGGFCLFYAGDAQADASVRALASQKLWKRFVTVFSGPLMNFAVAVLAVVIYVSGIGIESILPRVGELEENAQAAGLRIGDELIDVNGTAIRNANDVVDAINAAKGEEVAFTVLRDGQQTVITVRPFYDEQARRYRAGFSFAIERMQVSLAESLPFSVRYCVGCVQAIVDALGRLFTRGEGAQDITGIVGTVYVIQDATRSGGIDMFMELLAMISVNLGVMNLLPIPGLDGSKLLFLLAEAVRGKPLNERFEGAITMAGFALLFTLMIVLTYKDLMQILLGGF